MRKPIQCLKRLLTLILFGMDRDPNYPQVYWPYLPQSSWQTDFAQYWSGNSSYGVVIMLLNPEDRAAHMSFAMVSRAKTN